MGIQINGQTDTVTATDGSINVGGDVTIPGVLTYEDVTNIDSIGIGTFRNGIDVTSGTSAFAGRVNVGASNLNNRALNAINTSTTVGAVSANNHNASGILFQGYNSSVDANNASFVVRSNGSTGIGTDNPSQLLHLHSDSSHKILLKRGGQYPSECIFANEGNLLKISNNVNGIHFDVGSSSLATAMYIEDGGNIGIGTDNPSNTLSVIGSDTPPVYIAGANPGIKFEDTNASGTPISYIYASDGQLSLRADDGNESGSSLIEFKVDGSEKARITSDGTILMGGQTGSYDGQFVNLELRKDSTTVGGSMTLVNGQASQAGATCEIDCYQNYRGAGKIVFGRENANNWQSSAGSAASFLAFHTNNAGTVSERLRITAAGNVGIKHSDPKEDLHVGAGENSIHGTILISADTGLHHFLRFTNGYGGNSPHYPSGIWYQPSQNMELRAASGANTSNAQQLVLSSNGNIGVGLADPGTKLEVSGGQNQTANSFTDLLRVAANANNDSINAEVQLNFGISPSHTSTANRKARIQSVTHAGDATPLALNPSGGNVGIHEDTPTRALSISGSMNLSSGSKIESYSSTGNLTIQGGSTYPGGHIKMYGGSSSDMITFNTSGSSTASTERMRIRSNGDVILGPYDAPGSYTSVPKNVPYKIKVAPYGWQHHSEIACISMGSHHGTGQDDGQIIFQTATNVHSDTTGLVSRVRITEQGSLQNFCTNTTNIDTSNSANAGNSHEFIYCRHSSSALTNGTNAFRVTTNGNVTNTNNSYGSLSDQRLKENIVNAGSQWDDIKSIQIRKFNFRENTGHPTHTQLGLIAQEIESVSPGLVENNPVKDDETVLDANGNQLESTKSINYSVLYMKAVKALQESMARIETLEAKVAALESA